jgi:exodeoxyribonuclease V alpha subunit
MNPKTQALIEQARKAHAARLASQAAASAQAQNVSSPIQRPQAAGDVALHSTPLSSIVSQDIKQHGAIGAGALHFNPEQLQAIEFGLQAKSFCLIGAAGTGKTTVTQELISRLQRSSHVLPLSASTKHLNNEAPGIAILGYTNKAVNNIRKKLPQHLQNHCLTIHKILEYAPVYYEVPDSDGNMRKTMRFEPSYHAGAKLPHISTVICEESSMIGTDLFANLLAALPRPAATQFIFLGDLNQIPPVFGPSILGFKLAELPIVELTHVYRQALLSPIISLATAVRTESLKDIPFIDPASGATTVDNGEHGRVHFQPWKKRVDFEDASLMMRKFLPRIIESGEFDPEKDMILMPFNKKFGTIEVNKIIADYLSKKRQAIVYEVIARYQATYWAVGDRVMVDRHEAVIRQINHAIGYGGKMPQAESEHLDRWGFNSATQESTQQKSLDEMLAALGGTSGADEDAKNLASHTITVYIPDLDTERVLTTAGEINTMSFGYALSIHKSQGSEWERVFLFLHNSHATMMSRELIYTAVTRAKQSLFIVLEGDQKPYQNSIRIASQRPRIPGTTLAEKIEFFNRKAKELFNSTQAQTEE